MEFIAFINFYSTRLITTQTSKPRRRKIGNGTGNNCHEVQELIEPDICQDFVVIQLLLLPNDDVVNKEVNDMNQKKDKNPQINPTNKSHKLTEPIARLVMCNPLVCQALKARLPTVKDDAPFVTPLVNTKPGRQKSAL